MLLPLPLLLGLVARAPDDCYFATGRRLVVLETCDVGPATIDALTEAEGPPHPAAVRPPLARGVARPAAAYRVASAPWAPGTIEARLERAEEERARAVAERVVAEQQRDAAIRERDEARAEVARLRRAALGHGVKRGSEAATAPGPR